MSSKTDPPVNAASYTLPNEAADALPRIRASVIPRASAEAGYLDRLADGLGQEPGAAATIPLGGHLVAAPAYDLPRAILPVDAVQLKKWAMTLVQAMQAARENLLRASGNLVEGFRLSPRGVYVSQWADGYDSARLLLIAELRRLPVRGDLVAATGIVRWQACRGQEMGGRQAELK
jgi:hypothetical protein